MLRTFTFACMYVYMFKNIISSSNKSDQCGLSTFSIIYLNFCFFFSFYFFIFKEKIKFGNISGIMVFFVCVFVFNLF